MSASLTGQTPKNTYKQLAHFGDDGAFPADGETPQKLYKGDGTESPVSMTATKLFVNGLEIHATATVISDPGDYTLPESGEHPISVTNRAGETVSILQYGGAAVVDLLDGQTGIFTIVGGEEGVLYSLLPDGSGTLATDESVDEAIVASNTPFYAGNKSGAFTLAYPNGSTQLVLVTGNITLNAPSGATDGQAMTVILETTNTWTMDFADVQMPAEALALLPVTLENERVYVVDLVMAGYHMVLKSISAASLINETIPADITVAYNSTGIFKDARFTRIWNGWLKDETTVTSVTFGDIVTEIGERAFQGCTGLTGTLVIPEAVQTIGPRAFKNCTGLTGITLPSGLTVIDHGLLRGCSAITGGFTIPAGVTRLGWNVFRECTGMTGTLTLNAVVESIDQGCFRNAGFTGTLEFPASLSTAGCIGKDILNGTAGITRLDCLCPLTAFATDALAGSGVTEIHAASGDTSWTAGAGLTIRGKTGITVTKDL